MIRWHTCGELKNRFMLLDVFTETLYLLPYYLRSDLVDSIFSPPAFESLPRNRSAGPDRTWHDEIELRTARRDHLELGGDGRNRTWVGWSQIQIREGSNR